MTIFEAIEKADKINSGNQYSRSDKIRWLNSLDTQIKQELIDIRQDSEKIIFDGYTDDTDDSTELLVGVPYDELYIFYLASQIALYNGDTRKYNNFLATYDELLQQFRNYYNKQHKDKNVKIRF